MFGEWKLLYVSFRSIGVITREETMNFLFLLCIYILFIIHGVCVLGNVHVLEKRVSANSRR